MSFQPVLLHRPIHVDRVVTVHYFEYSRDYSFAGERHDFWELLYVDRGEVDVLAGERELRLSRGQMIFHPPGEFHAVRATGASAPNLVVVSFYCSGEELSALLGQTVTIGEPERALLGRIIAEAESAFSTPLDDPTTTALERREPVPFGAEQLLGAALEEMLIRLLRRGAQAPSPVENVVHARGQRELFLQVDRYLEERVSRPLTLAEICRDNLVGRSRLQQVFREQTGGGVMEYFGRKRIGEAKVMIREGRRNFTEIAAALGYQSIYYFSRHFKKVTGMSPSEYASSVRVLSAKDRPG